MQKPEDPNWEDEDEEAAMAMERDLVFSEQWKTIQKNTFTRWANEHLKTVNKQLTDLEGDFSDGLRLVSLIEVLAGKKFKHVNKRPNFRTQKLENVTMVLKFLEQDEGIRIVNIDSTDIVDKKLKLILGLIWTLILHYSISMPMWEGEEPTPSEKAPTPKQRLLNWIQSKVPDLPIGNFTNDWNDGRAIGALVDAIGPGLCPDWEDWDAKKSLANAKEAMDAAEKWLDVPKLIEPNEMINPKIDDLSMMTYLSQFPNAKLKPGAPLRPRINPARVRAYGPGLEPTGNQVAAPARFTVETFSAGKGTVEVLVLNPKGQTEPSELTFNDDRNLTYSCVYVPKMEGEHRVIIKFSTKEIPKSPFTVKVEGAAGDPSKVTASGPGLEKTGVIAGKKTYFEVFTQQAGKGTIDIAILDPHGHRDKVRPSITPVVGKEGTYLVEYISMEPGLYSINVFFSGRQIPGSPYGVNVAPASNAKACYATGRGVQARGIREKDKAVFYVHTKGAGDGKVVVQIFGPGGVEEKCQVTSVKGEEGVYECVYVPSKAGNYIINVTFGDQHISKSPFKIEVGPFWNTKIRAYGPGLTHGVVNQPAIFTVETNGETGALGFSIEGPSQAKIDCKDNGDGSADVTYWPTQVGEYAVHILCDDQDIPNSPYMANVIPAQPFFADKVIAKGPGLEKTGVAPNKPAEFTVDARAAGKAALYISCIDVDYNPVDVKVTDNGNGTYTCRYTATRSVKHTITITWGGVSIPNAPFRIFVAEPSNPSKVKVHGPGVEKGVKTFATTYFIVDCKEAGPGDVAVGLTSEKGEDVPVKTTDNQDGTFRVEYEPKSPGKYTAVVYFANKEVPQSPIKINVEAHIDVSKVKVVGLEPTIPIGQTREISVIAKGLPKSEASVKIVSPTNKVVEAPTSPTGDGAKASFTLLEPGPHKVQVTYGGLPVPGSPFSVEAVQGPANVKAYGPGLTEGHAETPAVFTVDAKDEKKPGAVGVTVEGPTKPKAEIKDNKDGTFEVSYLPTAPGDYAINVTHANRPIQKSPFKANIKEAIPNVKAYGPGLTEGHAETPAVFTVDAKDEKKPGAVGVSVEGPTKPKPEIKDNKDGTFEVSYVATVAGDYSIKVTHADRPIRDSPFKASIKEALPNVKAYGPGLTEGHAETPAVFTVDARDEKKPGVVGVSVEGPTKPTAAIKDNKDGTYEVSYVATEAGDYSINITHADRPIQESPFKANIKEALPNVKAYGPGLTEGHAETPAVFTVDARDEKKPGAVGVSVEGPTKPKIDIKNNNDGTYAVSYVPTVPGDYTIKVTHGDCPIQQSPFKASIQPSSTSPSDDSNRPNVRAYGPGLTEGQAEAPAVFTVDTRGEKTPGAVGVSVQGPTKPKIDIKSNNDGTFAVSYVPTTPGDYTINVTHGDRPIQQSPFKASIQTSYSSPANDSNRPNVRAYGPGLTKGQPDKPAAFTVDTRDEKTPGAVGVSVEGPTKPKIDIKSNDDGTFAVSYVPTTPGDYTINVTHADRPIQQSPFKASIQPSSTSPPDDSDRPNVRAYGPGLTEGQAEAPAVFTVDTRDEKTPGAVGVSVQGPTKPKIDIKSKDDGTFAVSYVPTTPGDYTINVTHADRPIQQSPFKASIQPSSSSPPDDSNRPNVRAYGPGLTEGQAEAPAVFTVDTRGEKTPGAVGVSVQGPTKPKIDIKSNDDGTFAVSYVPTTPGDYTINVTHADRPIQQSPFKASIQPSSSSPPDDSNRPNVRAYGPGLTKGQPDKPAAFTVDTRGERTPGAVGVSVQGPTKPKIDIKSNNDGTFAVSYIATSAGDYTINVTHADRPIQQSPFKASIQPSTATGLDVSGILTYGPGLEPAGVFLESPNEFTVDARSVSTTADGKVKAIVTSPSGKRTETLVKNKGDGTYSVLYTPIEEGSQKIDVTYEEIPIPESPLTVTAKPGSDASKVKAYGPGLEAGLTDEAAVFTVDLRGAGKGGLGLGIEGPVETPMQCQDNHDGTCQVVYQPTKSGPYDIAVKFNDQHIPGSPFHVGIKNPVNPAKVKCYGPGLESKNVKAGVPVAFTVDATEAGEAPLEVTVTDKTGAKRPAQIVPIDDGVFEATYAPVSEGPCQVDVKYANQSVPGSPFQVTAAPGVDASKVKVTGPGVSGTTPASLPVAFNVDTRKAGDADLEVYVKRPDGTFVKPLIQENQDGTYDVVYTPEDLGVYDITVKYGGQDVPGSPFNVKTTPTGDASKCKIKSGQESKILVNKEKTIIVDASHAGVGKITCRIRTESGSDIDIDIVEREDGSFSIAFTPQFLGDYTIEIKFGGELIPNGSYTLQAVVEEEYEEYMITQTTEQLLTSQQTETLHGAAPGHGLFQPVDFTIPVGPIFSFVSAIVVMPSGKRAYPNIEDNKDGTVTVKYQPSETGLHELHMQYNNEEIEGSPFLFHVEAIDSGFVTAYGPGLSHGVVYEQALFTINTKNAGAGGLSLAIEGPSKTEIQCKDNEDGTCTVSYLPTAPGEYLITVKFADQHIAGSPFTAKVTPGEPRRKNQILVGSSSEVSLKVTEHDIESLTATIVSPSGREEPCFLKRLPNGHLGITFTPRETGEHLVNVYRNGQHIANSPFKINVGDSEIGNASKVKVYGKGLKEGLANEVNEFIVDTREAGYGGMSLSIEGPSKADIECHDNEDGTCRVTYKPTEPGNYIINIKFADQHVPGSPYSVKIGGEPSAKITERITRHKEAADITHVGSQCELSLKIPGTRPFDMTASVKSPTGVTEVCDVTSLDDSHYSIKFVPKEMGVHIVSVKHRDMHIPGSPYEFTVGPIAGGGAHKVHASGPGLERGEVEIPNEFIIYTREAGAGGLSIALEGPSKAEIDFKDKKDGSCQVAYRVTEPGEYFVSVKFNDDHIPDSPFRVSITPSIGDARKLSVQSLQDRGLQVGKPAAFVVNFNGAKGRLTATVVSPSGSEEEALIQEIDDGHYAVRFIPRENGVHFVHVRFDHYDIPESPFKIVVGKIDADAGKVTAYGDGLVSGKTGQVSKFIVNTVNAGSGSLAVTVEGPSKVRLECREIDEGYEFSYSPNAPGDYLICIRYAGINIAGSPFKARVEGKGQASAVQEHASVVVETVTKTSTTTRFTGIQRFSSDASKVTVRGTGLTKAFQGKTASFTVDAAGAGNNMMYIGMMGPKGPCDELIVKHQGNLQYSVQYMVKDSGRYILVIKWGDQEIPGSPFSVEVQ
jgi:filamin